MLLCSVAWFLDGVAPTSFFSLFGVENGLLLTDISPISERSSPFVWSRKWLCTHRHMTLSVSSVAWLVYGAALAPFPLFWENTTTLAYFQQSSAVINLRNRQVTSIWRGSAGKPERDSSLGAVVTRSNGFKLKEGKFRLDSGKEFFAVEGLAVLGQIVQGGCECPNPGTIQNQFG